ncbi:MAG TPA: hemolysin family protein, partial [Lachnospiraceae bacterium]|nr:hemolysin family protein [Lachnospiraceae bacterium]
PFETDTIEILSLILIILLLSFFTLIFAELIPQHLAAKPAESFALGVSGLVLFTSGLLTPLVWLMNAFANGILKLFGVDPKTEDEIVTEEEILMMSDAGAEKGTIDEEDNKIIKNIFAFDDLTLEQICTHITDVIFLFEEKDENSWHETICNHRHRKFPICGSEIDDIIGILDVNDYFRLEDKSRENIMKNAVKEPFFVHEYMKADILLNKMKNHEAEHFAVVIDEYGGVSGIITVTDLVERLIGDFSETSSNTLSEEIKKTGENEWCASGIISLGDVAGVLGIELPSDTFDTLGGYLMSYASVFSKDTSVSHIDTDLLEADILKVHNHRIEKCRLRIKQPAVSSD